MDTLTVPTPNGSVPTARVTPIETDIDLPELRLNSRFGPLGATLKRVVARLIRFFINFQDNVNATFAARFNAMAIRVRTIEHVVDECRSEMRAFAFERARFEMLAAHIERLGDDWAKTANGRSAYSSGSAAGNGTHSSNGKSAAVQALETTSNDVLEKRIAALAARIDAVLPSAELRQKELLEKIAFVDERTAILERSGSSVGKLISTVSLRQTVFAEKVAAELEQLARDQDTLAENANAVDAVAALDELRAVIGDVGERFDCATAAVRSRVDAVADELHDVATSQRTLGEKLAGLDPAVAALDELRAEIGDVGERLDCATAAVRSRVDAIAGELHEVATTQRTLGENLAGLDPVGRPEFDAASGELHAAIDVLAERLDATGAEAQSRVSAVVTELGAVASTQQTLSETLAQLDVVARPVFEAASEELRAAAGAAESQLHEIRSRIDGVSDELSERIVALNGRVSAPPHPAVDAVGRQEVDALAEQLDATVTTLHALVQRLNGAPYMSRQVYDVANGPVVPKSSFDYVGFEKIFRGPESLILERQAVYVPFFERGTRVLDVGCGRGEFVELLSAANVDVAGIDLNETMVRYCRSKGLDNVEHADALKYLRERGAGHLAGIFSAQVIEHLSFDDLYEFLKLARQALQPGGVFIAETINPNSLEGWKTFFVDPTHVKPLFPETMQFMCRSAGFSEARIFYPNGDGFEEAEPHMHGEYAIVARG